MAKKKIDIGGYDIVITRLGITVGCTFVSLKTVERVLKAIKAAKPYQKFGFTEGQRVKVVKVIEGSVNVLGRTGIVIASPDPNNVLVRFSRFDGGHDGDLDDGSRNHWYVDPKALRKV